LRDAQHVPIRPLGNDFEIRVDGPVARLLAGSLAGGRRLVMLTNYCPYCSWVAANNDLIRAVCRQLRDCTVAEWEGLAAANPRWFYADGVHMPIGGVGGQAYADLVARMLERTPAPRLHEPS